MPRFAIAPLGLTTEGSTKFKLKGWKRYLKKLQCTQLCRLRTDIWRSLWIEASGHQVPGKINKCLCFHFRSTKMTSPSPNGRFVSRATPPPPPFPLGHLGVFPQPTLQLGPIFSFVRLQSISYVDLSWKYLLKSKAIETWCWRTVWTENLIDISRKPSAVWKLCKIVVLLLFSLIHLRYIIILSGPRSFS